MNHTCKTLRILLVLFLFLLPMACNEEDAPATGQAGNKMGLTLKLSAPPSLDIDTRAKADGVEVGDVWVVQFTSSSKVVMKVYRSTSDASTNPITPDTSTGMIEVKTGGTDFWNEDSRFYVIANAGADHAGLTTLQGKLPSGSDATVGDTLAFRKELQSLTKTFNGAAAITEPGLLTAGPIGFAKQTGGANTVSAAIIAHMKRTYARFNIKYQVKSADFPKSVFTPTSLTVHKLPACMAFYERAGETAGNYPSTDDIAADFLADTELYPSLSSTFVSGTPFTFYIAENLRGMGISATAQGKNLAGNGPLATGGARSLAGCTFVTLAGEYQYDAAHTGKIGVTYTFYLGGNLINDYNIERGKSYTLSINIASVNSADLRVVITDGNVAVFDEVTVESEVNVDI